ncbi:MAG: carboxymuconolactone decarboxylase family protein [Labilibaculum sp.]|nr:carboxymuconolactone decarboxylase family protein [Labilibaculum sp.]
MLNVKQSSIASISSYTSISDVGNLKVALNKGLDNGLTINELKEIFIQLIAYCGFPRGLRGISVCLEVLDERKAKGIRDEQGWETSPVTDIRSKYDRGEEVQMLVSGWSKEALRSGMLGFYPKIDVVLKEYVFADIYDSDVLNYADREIATVSAQMSMDGIEPMVQAHINAAFNVGLDEEEVRQLIDIIERQFDEKRANKCRTMLDNVLSARSNR